MPYVIQHPNKTYLAKKDAWSTEWSDKLNDARLFPTIGATTRASRTLNDGYGKPESVDVSVVEVDVVLAADNSPIPL